MYYNLKITTKDSELGLESNDKYIIAREMDIYFARIFGASKEFEAAIKDVEINRPELVSINELNKPEIGKQNTLQQNEQFIKEEAKLNIPESQNQKNITIQDEIPQYNSSELMQSQNIYKEKTNHISLESLQELKGQDLIQEEKSVNQIIKNTQDSTDQHANRVNHSINEIFFDKNLPDAKSDIKESYVYQQTDEPEDMLDGSELEKEAQKLFNELQTQVKKEEIKENIKQDFNNISSQEYTQNQQQVNYDIDNIQNNGFVNNVSPFQDVIDAYKEQKILSKIENNSVTMQQAQNNEDSKENSIVLEEPILLNINNLETNKKSEDSKEDIQITQVQQQDKNNNEIEIQPDIVEPDKNKQENTQNNLPNMSFSMFLGGYATTDIHNEFLVCALYIKNALHQSSFSMKYINSKLFQATGKIADTSVVDELINKEYINIISTNERNEYAITPKGEEYLVTILQG